MRFVYQLRIIISNAIIQISYLTLALIRFKFVRVIDQDISAALVSDIDYSAANSIRKSKNAKRITKETSNQTIVLHLTTFFEYYYEEEKISSMCKLEDLVNINILQSMYKLIIEGKQEEFDRLLQKSLSPEKVNNKFISLGGWQLDISGTIYKKANPVEVIEGWQFLLDKNIPIDVYTKAFLITSLYTLLPDVLKNDVEVNNQIKVSNLLEPELSELVRLFYWINVCRRIIDRESFEIKFNEFRDIVQFENESEFRKRLNNKFITFGRIMKDGNIPYDNRKAHATQLVKELECFRTKISSFLPEFMLAALVQGEGFNVRFISTTTAFKTCDLLFNSHNTEVKTFLDSYKQGTKIECSLIKEIECTLKRKKAVYYINDALSKKADIIFMYLTFSSLAMGFAKYTFEKNMSFPLLKALRESISICDKNAMKQTIETIPVVVFTTLIDSVSCDYKIFSLMVPYPVKMNKMNQVEADSEKLLIKLDKDSHRSEYLKI